MLAKTAVASTLTVLLATIGWSAHAQPPTTATPAATVPVGSPATPTSYVAVIDAGSSGSRIYLYDGRATANRVVVHTLFEAEPEVPGLSTFVDHPSRAGAEGVTPLLAELKVALNARSINTADVTVHLLATAGMRNVQLEAPSAVRHTYASARRAIDLAGLPVGAVQTISGKHEGLYSWTDVNYLRGVFRGAAAPRGIAEVGGASSQVAFVTSAKGKNVAKAQIAGRTYRVFSVSYLGLGQNDGRNAIIRPRDQRRGNPCFPNNASGENPAFYALKNDVPVNAARSRYRFRDCVDEARTTIDRTTTNHYNAKHTHGATVATIQSTKGFAGARFLGLASIAHALSDFGVTGGHEATRLARALRDVCGGANAWPDVLAQFGGKVSQFSENACANASYNRAWVLSRTGLHIDSDRFRAATEIAGKPLTWTRGFAVLQAAKG